MKMPTDKSWYGKMAAKEGDHEISAGRRLTSTINLTPEEIAEIERLQLEALPAWARDRISQQDAELERLKAVIAWANNSLFGSHGFFLSLTLGAHDEHHLDRAIEDLKARARNAETENATLKAGIKRLSEEEELISETGSDEALTAVHLAARLAEAEELARVMEAEANQLREVSISNRQRAEAYRKALERIIDLDHHNMGPESAATKIARAALQAEANHHA